MTANANGNAVQQALASVPALVEELLSRVPKGFGQFYPKEGGQQAGSGNSSGSSGAARPKEGEWLGPGPFIY
jgi:hypothetical protein